MIRFPIGSLEERTMRGEPLSAGPDVSLAPAPPSNAGPEYLHGGDFATESGEVIPDLALCYETWGEMERFRSSVVLLCHGSTGDRPPKGWLSPSVASVAVFPSRDSGQRRH